MPLTRKGLNKILRSWRIWYIPAALKRELLEQYGNLCTDDQGNLHDYTEQDICEQLRKILRPYENHQQRCANPIPRKQPAPASTGKGQLSQATQADREYELDAAK